jgi:hypothetical protein
LTSAAGVFLLVHLLHYSPVPQDSYTLEFDAGANPQAGQEWILNHEFRLAGHAIDLVKITAVTNGFTFFLHTGDEDVESLGMYDLEDIQLEGCTPIDFGGSFGIGNWSLTKIYSEMPFGKLTVRLSGLSLYGKIEEWTLDWQPWEDIPSRSPSALFDEGEEAP